MQSQVRYGTTTTHFPQLLLKLVFLTAVAMLTACGRSPAVAPIEVPTDAVKLNIIESGIYKVTLSDLTTVGLQLEQMDSDSLALTQLGVAVPYLIEDNALIFYGQAPDDRYSPFRPYILRTGQPGNTMPESPIAAAATPILPTVSRSLRLEENNAYTAESIADEPSDPWFWQKLGQGQVVSLQFTLPNAVPEAGLIRIRLWGSTHNPEIDGDHDFQLLLNGVDIGQVQWDGRVAHTAEIDIPAGVLQDGLNIITLDNQLPGAAFLDIMELNWLEIQYRARPTADEDRLAFAGVRGAVSLGGFSDEPLIFDVTDPAAPQRLTEWVYESNEARLSIQNSINVEGVGPKGFLQPVALLPLVKSQWQEPGHQADLIIIAPDTLAPALTPLVEARAEQGIQAVVVTTEEIYDGFGEGAATPASVTAFITYAYEQWQAPQPKYLLIVGDATSDFRGYLDHGPTQVVPSPMVTVSFGGETVSDSRLVDVDGDIKPELAVGRWPVNSVEEVESLVARTLAYEQNQAAASALTAVDDTDPQFADMAARLWRSAGYRAEDMQLMVGGEAADVADSWNEGNWLTTYIGHGSVQQWGKNQVFNLEAVDQLDTAQPPIVLQLTCLTGLFAHPELTSLSERMMLHPQGPVLLVAATSLTLSTDQEPFAAVLLENLGNRDYARIGDAFQSAKRSLAVDASGGLREISDTFVLLGDPSALIVRPQS